MLELTVHSTAKTAFSWPGRVVQAKKKSAVLNCQFYFFTDKIVRGNTRKFAN